LTLPLPGTRLHATTFVAAGCLSLVAGAWGGVGAVVLLFDGPGRLLAVPAFLGGAVGMSYLAAILFRLIPARCPAPECRGRTYLVGSVEYRCTRCEALNRVEGISGTSHAPPAWLERISGARIEAWARLSERHPAGRLSIAVPGVAEGALSPAAEAGGLAEAPGAANRPPQSASGTRFVE